MGIWSISLIKSDLKWCIHLKLHSHQTADQPTTNADKIVWLGRVWSGKKIPALIEERFYPRSTLAVSLMHPRSNPALLDLPPSFLLTNPRSARPTPDLSLIQLQSIHYGQYRTNPRSVCLISTPGLKWIIQANVMPTVLWRFSTRNAHMAHMLSRSFFIYLQ